MYPFFFSSTKSMYWLRKSPRAVTSQNFHNNTQTLSQTSKALLHQVSISTGYINKIMYYLYSNITINHDYMSLLLIFSSLFFSELEVLKFLESYPKYSNANNMHPDTVKTAVYIQHLFMVGFMLYRYFKIIQLFGFFFTLDTKQYIFI